jgi:hypothetical protein
VKVRLLGEQPGCRALAAVLTASAAVDVVSADGPYANRREPGGRLYLIVRARAAKAFRRSEVRFDLGDSETYFVLTEALLDFAARERAAGGKSRLRLAETADTLLALVDAVVPAAQATEGPAPGHLESPAPACERKRGPGGSHPPGPLAPISSRSPLDA